MHKEEICVSLIDGISMQQQFKKKNQMGHVAKSATKCYTHSEKDDRYRVAPVNGAGIDGIAVCQHTKLHDEGNWYDEHLGQVLP